MTTLTTATTTGTSAPPLDGPTLTPQQYAIIDGLAEGNSIAAIARTQGLHRTTIHHWRRTNPDFAEALRDARLDRAQEWQAAADPHAAAAFALVREIMDDKTASHATRLRAAALIIRQSTKTPPAPTQDELRRESLLRATIAIAAEDRAAKEASTTKSEADSSLFITSTPVSEPEPVTEPTIHPPDSSLFITSTPIDEPAAVTLDHIKHEIARLNDENPTLEVDALLLQAFINLQLPIPEELCASSDACLTS